jgi:polyprenyl-phospho-N-acetylgalactosaminyl synthase
MTVLQLFFIISGLIILLLSVDIARREKFNALHFFVFLTIGIGLLIFTFFPSVLDTLGNIVGLSRWADALVYWSIIFLIYMSLLLLSKSEENKHSMTRMIREFAIEKSEKKKIEAQALFLVRVYNEASILESTLDNIIKAGYKDMLIIDDGSKDASWKIIEKYMKRYDTIIWVKHHQNRGAGAALETWFEYIRRYAQVDYIVTFDADGQHRVEDISHFFQAFESHPKLEVILWSRFLREEDKKNIPFSRRITLRLWRIFTKMMTGIHLSDAHNGYRVFRSEALQKVRLTADSMAYASELVEQIALHKLVYAEVPVHILYSEYSLKKWQKSSNAIFIVLHTIWSKFLK